MTTVLLATHRWHADGPWFPLVPLVVAGVWLAVLVTVARRWRQAPRRAAETVLAERFARGEIDETEWRDRRAVLRRR
jgi:putative membrane protein